jgi:hypothetical protein
MSAIVRNCSVAIGSGGLFEREYEWITIAESAKRCAIEFAEAYLIKKDLVNGCNIDVVVIDEMLGAHKLTIALKVGAKWTNQREGCGDTEG